MPQDIKEDLFSGNMFQWGIWGIMVNAFISPPQSLDEIKLPDNIKETCEIFVTKYDDFLKSFEGTIVVPPQASKDFIMEIAKLEKNDLTKDNIDELFFTFVDKNIFEWMADLHTKVFNGELVTNNPDINNEQLESQKTAQGAIEYTLFKKIADPEFSLENYELFQKMSKKYRELGFSWWPEIITN